MTNPYIGQDVLDQCHEAIRSGRTIDQLAGKRRVDSNVLINLLGLPRPSGASALEMSHESDLWAADRLASQL